MQFSVQMYSVREALASDFQGTVSRLVDLGLTHAEPYHLVEFREELVRAREQFAIDFPSAHQSFLGDVDFDEILEAAQAVGVQYLVDPHWKPEDWTDAAAVRELAATLNARAASAITTTSSSWSPVWRAAALWSCSPTSWTRRSSSRSTPTGLPWAAPMSPPCWTPSATACSWSTSRTATSRRTLQRSCRWARGRCRSPRLWMPLRRRPSA